MSALTVELTGKEREFVEEQVARGAAPSPTEYVNDLIRRQQTRTEELSEDSDDQITSDLRAQAEAARARDPEGFQEAVERVHQLIRDGINSGRATEMTDADWQRIRRNVRDRLSRPAGS